MAGCIRAKPGHMKPAGHGVHESWETIALNVPGVHTWSALTAFAYRTSEDTGVNQRHREAIARARCSRWTGDFAAERTVVPSRATAYPGWRGRAFGAVHRLGTRLGGSEVAHVAKAHSSARRAEHAWEYILTDTSGLFYLAGMVRVF